MMSRIDDHMVGIWAITTMPLRAKLFQDNVVIEQSTTGRVISSRFPQAIFLGLEPKEVVEILDRDLTKMVGEPVSILRRDFSGHNKNPFSAVKIRRS
jgi:hypothetical protein